MGTIYQIRNKITDAVYVGSVAGNRLRARWMRHVNDLRAQAHHNRHLQRAWNKYGEEAFEFSRLEDVDDACLLQREQSHIDARKSLPRRLTYNTCPVAGNCTGRKFSEASRKKMSQSHMGMLRSPESCERQARSWTERYGQVYSLRSPDGAAFEMITNLRGFAKEHGLHPSGIRGVIIGKTNVHKGWTRLDYQRPVYSVRSPNGEEFHNILDLKAFCLLHELHYRCMHAVLQGDKKSYRGWTVTCSSEQRRRRGVPKWKRSV